MLEARALTKRYASLPAVQDLSFQLSAGQVLGCLGPNGSGKSTTVKMLTGLLEPTRGEVLFRGKTYGKTWLAIESVWRTLRKSRTSIPT
jgi:ABC-2 type transport system ATP-binding protein